MKKRIGWISIVSMALLLVAGTFSGCTETAENTNPGVSITGGDTTITVDQPEGQTGSTDGSQSSSETEPEAAEQTAITVTDQTGVTVTLEGIPRRIVSLSPSNTEILFALELGDKVVGVSDYCNFPEAALEKAKIGGYATSDVESIVALEPDIVFTTNMHVTEIVPALNELGVKTFTLDPRNLDEVLQSVALVGELTGSTGRAEELIGLMETRIDAVKAKVAGIPDEERPGVFYVMWHDPLMTVGTDTRIHELIEIAGGRNIVTGQEGYPTISLEVLLEADPQVIIAGSGMGAGADAPYQFALTESRLEGVSARVNGMVFEVNTDLTGRPGPRMVYALEDIAACIHPELFD